MPYKIICPFCFKETTDDGVMFRSELINRGESDFLPDGYDSLEDFIARFKGPAKDSIIYKEERWRFFQAGKDPQYEHFWETFGGTTEDNPIDKETRVPAYYRKVINPLDNAHQKYLRLQPDGTYFIRDGQGMVSQIELSSGEKCGRRVCPSCHNPFPDNYGKYSVRFATVVGITGAGKTVYLSSLLKNMKTYAIKAGLSSIVTNSSVRTFLEKNKIDVNVPLPGSTPKTSLQQPLFYEMIRTENGEKKTETFVMYDVAGELFKEDEDTKKFAPFIEHADGVIVLIDPFQFGVVNEVARNSNSLSETTTALNQIHNIISHGAINEKNSIPLAICISKADMPEVQSVLPDDLRNLLLDDVHGIKNSNGFYLPIFNAKEYAPIGRELNKFFKENEIALAQLVDGNYSSYAYFAFTALGCNVREENGKNYPVGPVLSKRVEEPLLWLFYKLGYIDKNGPIPGEIICPNCGMLNNYEVPFHTIVERRGLFKKVERNVNRHCRNCDYEWEYVSEE